MKLTDAKGGSQNDLSNREQSKQQGNGSRKSSGNSGGNPRRVEVDLNDDIPPQLADQLKKNGQNKYEGTGHGPVRAMPPPLEKKQQVRKNQPKETPIKTAASIKNRKSSNDKATPRTTKANLYSMNVPSAMSGDPISSEDEPAHMNLKSSITEKFEKRMAPSSTKPKRNFNLKGVGSSENLKK